MRLSALTQKISVQLVQDIIAGTFSGGDHIAAQQIADRYGVSRTPVREALGLLEARGVLKRRANRGYFVDETAPDAAVSWFEEQQASMSDGYQRMAEDWLRSRLPEEVTEHFLRERYDWTKTRTTEFLMRAAREGWAERKEGYGWRFLHVAKTPEAFEEIYRFRLAIEPAAILEPSFEINRSVLEEQRRIQEGMLENGTENTPTERLLDNGAIFHEEITRMSNNPNFLTALQRVNRMRRLMEYRTEINFQRFFGQCSEHLELLDLLERGEIAEASYFMRRHLGGALQQKSPLAWNRSSEIAASDDSA